jgi:DNA-binding transcriptional ArsR family regulator
VDAALVNSTARWELYRLLGEPIRLRILTLASVDELSVGELGELTGESQPNISKHVAALRRAGLLQMRKQGTRVFVRVPNDAELDAVVADAVAAGRTLCEGDGSLDRVAQLVRERDRAARELFARGSDRVLGQLDEGALPAELPAYLSALAPLIPNRRLALDAGTGDGRLLDVLAPIFERVIGVDRSASRLERAKDRAYARGYERVEFFLGELDDRTLVERVRELGGVDVLFASRILHHAPRPRDLLRALGALCTPGGALVVLDYAPHQDERMRDSQADLWLGFAPSELLALAKEAGLSTPSVRALPASFCGTGPDAHIAWQVLFARTPSK